jgi:DNA-directed RNA polymerase specialized sigma24 family protein
VVRGKDNPGVYSSHVEDWELDLIRKIASRFRTTERDELEAELAKKLADLKSRPLSGVRHWQAYLAKFLFNKASNWIRDSRVRENKSTPLPDEHFEASIFRESAATDENLPIAFRRVWNEIDPDLRRFWQILLAENGNQVATAKRLGVHRNTVRLWIRRIQHTLNRHGFSP